MLKSKSCLLSDSNANIKCFSMVSLKVDNLTYRTNDRDLEYLFEKYGKVKQCVFTPGHILKLDSISRSEIFTFQETNTARRVAALHLYDFTTEGTQKTRWIL